MIPKDDLIRIAKSKGIYNRGYAEKDYLLDLFLYIISSETKDELVFKGGTCIYKLYGTGRFSEDLDFSATKEIDIGMLLQKITQRLKDWGIECSINSRKEQHNATLISFKVKGPLYSGEARTESKIRIDINHSSEVFMPPITKRYSSSYPGIPQFSVLAMDEREILSEKVRAVISRDMARDAYDLWLLVKKGISIDKKLIQHKLSYYNFNFDAKLLRKKLEAKKGLWKKELTPLVFGDIPEFNEAMAGIMKSISPKS